MTLARIKDRPTYLAVAATGRRWVTPSFIVQYQPANLVNSDASQDHIVPAVGFTVTKKVGKAVIRNRMRRRMKEAARQVMPEMGQAGARYVLIGRESGIEAPFEKMLKDLRWALEKLGKNADLNSRSPKRQSADKSRDKSGHKGSTGSQDKMGQKGKRQKKQEKGYK